MSIPRIGCIRLIAQKDRLVGLQCTRWVASLLLLGVGEDEIYCRKFFGDVPRRLVSFERRLDRVAASISAWELKAPSYSCIRRQRSNALGFQILVLTAWLLVAARSGLAISFDGAVRYKSSVSHQFFFRDLRSSDAARYNDRNSVSGPSGRPAASHNTDTMLRYAITPAITEHVIVSRS